MIYSNYISMLLGKENRKLEAFNSVSGTTISDNVWNVTETP